MGLKWTIIIPLLILLPVGCGSNPSGGDGANRILSSYSPTAPANLRVSLTDKPSDEVQQVHVNIDHIEIMIDGAGKSARVKIGDQLGDIDLLTLKNGVLLPIQDILVPGTLAAHGLRLILKDIGNYIIMNDGSRCDLDTPSAQQSGVKVIMQNHVTFDPAYSYSMVIDFDASKSIVIKGNGGCSLKPVLKLPYFTRVAVEQANDGTSDGTGDQLTDGNDGSSNTVGIADGDVPPTDQMIDPSQIPAYFFQ
jgi:hypothetical protein